MNFVSSSSGARYAWSGGGGRNGGVKRPRGNGDGSDDDNYFDVTLGKSHFSNTDEKVLKEMLNADVMLLTIMNNLLKESDEADKGENRNEKKYNIGTS